VGDPRGLQRGYESIKGFQYRAMAQRPRYGPYIFTVNNNEQNTGELQTVQAKFRVKQG